MIRVLKIFLNRGFTPIHQNVFKLNTTITFDCYIQRFNGFYILIKSGTTIDEIFLNQITQNDLQIYVENKSYQLYKKYRFQHNPENNNTLAASKTLNLDDEIQNCITIKNMLTNDLLVQEKLKIIYTNATNILNAWILRKNTALLPLQAFENIIENLVEIVNKEKVTLSYFNNFLDDHYTLATHLVKVTFFASIIGSKIDHDKTYQKKLSLAALLHDLGEAILEDNIIDKADVLTKSEFKSMQDHVDKSILLIKKSGVKDRIIINAIKEQHERLDGSGYPSGITQERISPYGRILAVCDVFDALITIKPYRGAYTTFNALKLMRKELPSKIDMHYTDILIKSLT